MQHASFAHEGLRYLEVPRDGGQFLVEHAGEGEQIVALIPPRDAHRADAPRILRLEAFQFIGDEVEQFSPRGQVRTGQRQNVVAQPLDEGADTAAQFARPGFGLPCHRQFGDERLVRIRLIRTAGLGLKVFTPRPGALGDARQRIGEGFALVDDVKDIAMTRRIAPGGLLPGAQALPGIGDRIIGVQSLLGGVEQMQPQVSASRCSSAAKR